jgi:glutamate-ammonia-ligase adenylyltransferase
MMRIDPAWQAAVAHSHYLRQLFTMRPEIADWLSAHADQALDVETLRRFLDSMPVSDDDTGLKRTLRGLRQRVMATLIVRDLSGAASLAEVVETMTLLADLATNCALDVLYRQLAAQYGEALDRQGQPQRLLVVGMGKLGGRELNVSSDVDYIFVYPEEGKTAGRADGGGKIEAYDFFAKLGKRLIAVLNEATEDGRVFRVDMRLRPNGDSGPLVGSLDSLENYFITQGREWERYAWIKARVINEGVNLQPEWALALGKIARPFVFRKYLDFGAINAMRDLHAQIQREVVRKDMVDHIKLGPGGIREVEFIAQVFQLIRGGRDPALQVRPTLKVLALLVDRRLLPIESVQELSDAYVFLRRLEHRLQYVDDAQTHMLPSGVDERMQIAESLGFGDWTALFSELNAHRAKVALHFGQIFSDPEEGRHALAGLWFEQSEVNDALAHLSALGFQHPQAMLDRLQTFRQSGRYLQLPASNRERLDALGPRLIDAAAKTSTPDATWRRGLDFFQTISRRGAYLALLQQYPQALTKVAELIGSSSWAAEYLTHHPILLDELLDPRLYEMATDWPRLRDELNARLAEYADDAERQMDILREVHHAQTFRLLVQDLAGLQTIEQLSDRLTELADIVLQTTLTLCWEKLRSRYPLSATVPKLAVIGYGKLGGKELGYVSDLDIVFVHNDPDTEAGERYARLVQRVCSWLSNRTVAGILFETDLRLRPNGDAGMLVCPIEAFRDYQLKNAWVWEHQALTRARFCAGDPALGAQFEMIRIEVLRQPRDLDKLRAEVLSMRQRMLDNRSASDEEFFDIKQDPGGIIDVEFIVQHLVLGHAHAYPELCKNYGNIALLGIAAVLELIPTELANPVRDAYREFRRIQHAQRLNGGATARVARASVRAEIDAVRALWRAVFE